MKKRKKKAIFLTAVLLLACLAGGCTAAFSDASADRAAGDPEPESTLPYKIVSVEEAELGFPEGEQAKTDDTAVPGETEPASVPENVQSICTGDPYFPTGVRVEGGRGGSDPVCRSDGKISAKKHLTKG